MKIVMLSKIDYAGSGFRLFQAIRRHTQHEINLFSGPPENKLNHPINNLVSDKNREYVQRLVNEADILHFKGDWPPEDGYLGLRIPDKKPIVITTSGSFFRKKEHKGIGRYSNKDYYRATLKTSFETDLLYPEYSDIWTPHPIDSEDKPIIYRQTAPPVFMHIPSSPDRKGTEFVKKVFDVLRRKMSCRAEIITGIDFNKSLELKKMATIYFDQFEVGFYGNSALEAMQYGIPVVCWISPMALAQSKGKLKNCPIINMNHDPLAVAENVLQIYADDVLSKRTKEWCDSVHGYRAIADQWNKLYNSI